MGLDRFANFITKSINNEGVEEIFLTNNVRKVAATHVIFDLNFLIYQEIILIENEINDIIKTILCLPFSTDKGDILESLLKIIFSQNHWKEYYDKKTLEILFDGYNEDEIIQKFISCITSKISDTNSLSILELVVYEKIIDSIINNIQEIHVIDLVQDLLIFYDGIPSFSKIIEQRRRRIKNHLESNQKKILFKTFFDKLSTNNKNLFDNLSKNYIPTNIQQNCILFDYFKWIKNRFSIDKSIGPSTNFIKNLEKFIKIKINKILPKINLYINSSNKNGEADLKIFEHISKSYSYGDFCIHTTDSDLIHMILVQQTYYKIINKDINLTVMKYIKSYNSSNIGVVIDANIIIKNILDIYYLASPHHNNIKTYNYKIIWDICLIFLFFGNDHLPGSIEIGPELGLEFFLKKHNAALGKNNIVNNINNDITIDLKNLLLYLEKINETKNNNITKIILQRFFKINTYLINIFVDKFNLDFNNLLDFLKTFIIFKGLSLSDEDFNILNNYDMRKVFVKELQNNNLQDIEYYKTINCFKLGNNKLLLDHIQLIEDNIDYYSYEYNGLILYNKSQNITIDPYQDLYNYITDNTTILLTKKYPYLYDYIDISYHLHLMNTDIIDYDSNDYLKKIFHITTTQFGSMENFHSDNLTFYKYNNIPSLDIIIAFIKNSSNNIINTWQKDIQLDNLESSKYINMTNHYFLISPFITLSNISEELKLIISKINNIWLSDNITDIIKYRDIDIRKFLELCANTNYNNFEIIQI
jgi:hypothetical protein